MRRNIVHEWAGLLTYEIRGIVKFANKLIKLGIPIIWENIWDPVQKWHFPPDWMKEIIQNEMKNNMSYAYCPTQWVRTTNEYLAKLLNSKWWVQISSDDILFGNWLGDLISTLYSSFWDHCRVIWPNPAYPTHSSAESSRAHDFHITYPLDPYNNWQPNIEVLYNKVKYDTSIVWILLINPDNPTWAVYPLETLEKIVKIANDFDLLLIADEIYSQTTYWLTPYHALSEIIWKRPWIAMKWISKEFPWPWARCWWLEFYNTSMDQNFSNFVESVKMRKMLEVCSTTLPQRVIPIIMHDSRYLAYQQERNRFFSHRADQAYDIFNWINWIKVNRTQWAFYFTILFEPKITESPVNKPLLDKQIQDIIDPELAWATYDKRFVLYLLASRWICTVPLTWFNTSLEWIRITLLEQNEQVFLKTCNDIRDFIIEYTKWQS